jgi:ribosomal protein S12 methylthiotransferase accessory factor
MTSHSPSIGIDGQEWRSSKWASDSSTTARAMAAEDTWERIHPLLADYGITRVANVTGLDTIGIPVFNAIKPLGRSLSSGSGKGTTAMAARVGAAMEAIEQAVWESQPLGDIFTSEDELTATGQPFISTQRIVRYHVNLLSPNRPLHWTRGWDIVGQRAVLVPSLAVCIPDTYRNVWGGPVTSTNGLASGNTVLEAVVSGLLEVIERDAVSNDIATSRSVDTDSVSDLVACELLAQLAAANLQVSLVDFTANTAVATYAVTLQDEYHSGIGSYVGYGTNLNSDVALVRAITEAAQVHTVVVAGSRDDVYDLDRRAEVLLNSRRRFAPASSGPELGRYVPLDESTNSFEGDIHTLLRKLADVGIHEVVVIRHSSPNDPVQVVRVIVPDLWANLHGGTETFPHLIAGSGRR